jgi:hypothetical protein
MKIPKWNRCVVENKKYICKAEHGKQDCIHAQFGPKMVYQCYKEWNGVCFCCKIIAQKEALGFLVDRCERDLKWAGFQLSALE